MDNLVAARRTMSVRRRSKEFRGALEPASWDRGRVWPFRNTPVAHVCYLAEFDRRRSNRMVVGKGCRKFWERLGPFLLNWGVAGWLLEIRASLTRVDHTEFGHSRSNHVWTNAHIVRLLHQTYWLKICIFSTSVWYGMVWYTRV